MYVFVAGAVVVPVGAVGSAGGDGGLGGEVEVLDVEAGAVRGVQAGEDTGSRAGEVGARGCDDGEGWGRGGKEVPG